MAGATKSHPQPSPQVAENTNDTLLDLAPEKGNGFADLDQ